MSVKKNDYTNIPNEKFNFVNQGERIHDKKFDDKPISYLRDAWNRFCKNRASVIAAVIIICIVLFAFVAPLTTSMEPTFMDTYYAKKGPRNLTLREIGIAEGTVSRDFSEKSLVAMYAIGVGAENYKNGVYTDVSIDESKNSYYQPVRGEGEVTTRENARKQEEPFYVGWDVETYLEVGFIYKSVKQDEYAKMLAWQEETGIQLLYPLIEENEYNPDPTNANNWYKMDKKYNPQKANKNGKLKDAELSGDLVLVDNYKRDAEGNIIDHEYTGGGSFETAQLKVRVLYYNYYRYVNGFEPEYLFGTDSQGYDLALRVAGGIKLSLLIAVFVSLINFIIGALYGAVEGYYGGWIDLVLERISDILWGVPTVVVQTLFQIHLAAKVGAIPSLLFAFVLTGWIGTAARVRTQFYRFKNQEYVMAARTLGARDRRIIWKHIFPNTLGTLITSSALVIPGVIFTESMLSFLGIVKLGTAEQTSLGTLLSDANGIWTNYPHLMIVPALFISLLMISFNLFGNGLRDAFNPSLRGVEE